MLLEKGELGIIKREYNGGDAKVLVEKGEEG